MQDNRATKYEARAIQAALRATTETLAHALARGVAPTNAWSDYEWRVARATVAIHGVAPLLSEISGWQAPAQWLQFLQEQKQHTLARHRRIEALLASLHESSRKAGIALVALKGAALHDLGLYAPGERPMGDVDLLAAETQVAAATRMIEALGFQRELDIRRHQVFVAEGTSAALGEHAANPMKIELHTSIAEQLPVRLTQISVFPANPAPGLNPYPSRAALMLHLLLHAAGAIVNRAVRLIHLNDLALLSSCMSDSDWQGVLRSERAGPGRDGARHGLWWALPPLTLTARYFSNAVPRGVLDELGVQCPRRLRRAAGAWTLSDMSLSRLWVDAFPGVAWSRSAAETLRYLGSRIRPDAAIRSVREDTLKHHPAPAQVQWQHLSQGRRMLRWATSRPARDETLFVVRTALEQPP